MRNWLGYEWTPEAISSYGIIFFIFFGSVALGIQGWKIWKNKSGDSVSATWVFIFFFMFITYPIFGVKESNSLLAWQGVFRIAFYIPILYGLYKFKGFTKKELLLVRLLFIMIFIMIEFPRTGEFVFSMINFFAVLGVFAQGELIRKEKSAGMVSPVLLFAYAVNVVVWIWYSYEIDDWLVFANSALFLFSYGYTIALWMRFRHKRVM